MARRGRGGGRWANRAASNSNRTPTPQIVEPSDDEMQDVQPSGAATPQEDEGDEPEAEEEEPLDDGDEEGPSTPANGSERPSRNTTPARGRGSVRRRAGRPPKNTPRDWDAPDDTESKDGASDVGTPRKRGGWRGRGFGGGRWGKPRGGPSHVSQVPLDKEGNMANVVDDEVELPEDPEGEEKVDKNGYLKGGREYRVRVFTIQGKGERLYMLSTEPARCIGFRDSYLFFQKHRQLFKIILPEDAKRDLIDRTLIPHSYKGRAIGVVTARSVYREFGARIIIGGKKVMDDYQVTAARANGDIEGELAVPDDQLPTSGKDYDKNRYVAWHGASSVYHSGAPSIPMPNSKLPDGKKRKTVITDANWQLEHAQAASRFNSHLLALRRATHNGVYDIYTNTTHYPKSMQPTHARWEQLPTPPASAAAPPPSDPSIFPPLPPHLARNFLTTDIVFQRAPVSNLPPPGPDGLEWDLNTPSLLGVDDEVVALLPGDCKRAFEEARAAETAWRLEWGDEARDGHRGRPGVSYN